MHVCIYIYNVYIHILYIYILYILLYIYMVDVREPKGTLSDLACHGPQLHPGSRLEAAPSGPMQMG